MAVIISSASSLDKVSCHAVVTSGNILGRSTVIFVSELIGAEFSASSNFLEAKFSVLRLHIVNGWSHSSLLVQSLFRFIYFSWNNNDLAVYFFSHTRVGLRNILLQ